jgi:hypothetical protein
MHFKFRCKLKSKWRRIVESVNRSVYTLYSPIQTGNFSFRIKKFSWDKFSLTIFPCQVFGQGKCSPSKTRQVYKKYFYGFGKRRQSWHKLVKKNLLIVHTRRYKHVRENVLVSKYTMPRIHWNCAKVFQTVLLYLTKTSYMSIYSLSETLIS